MKIVEFTGPVDHRLARSLEEFECQFRYPLGGDRWFRISHGDDYGRFYSSMGESVCLIAEFDGDIRGVISVAIVSVLQPSGRSIPTAYFGDLKVKPSDKGRMSGRVALRLLNAATEWALKRTQVGIAVVMDGTPVLPTSYTGRLGIPAFEELGKIAILRIPAAESDLRPSRIDTSDIHFNAERCRKLATAGYRVMPQRVLKHERVESLAGICGRSAMTPIGISNSSGTASGFLEDTRLAKRLFLVDGDELISAHLSCFAYQEPQDGAELIQDALGICAELSIPALFVAVPRLRVDGLLQAIDKPGMMQTGATVFGLGFEKGADWYIQTAEI